MLLRNGSATASTTARITRELGDVPLEDVTPELLEQWKRTLGLSNRSVAKYLVILHGIFKRAVQVWGLPRNPVLDVERPRYRVSDDLDAFSPEEVWALVRAAGSEQDAAMFLTAPFWQAASGRIGGKLGCRTGWGTAVDVRVGRDAVLFVREELASRRKRDQSDLDPRACDSVLDASSGLEARVGLRCWI
jgi:hypothetical protein